LSFANRQPAALWPGAAGLHVSSVHALPSVQFALTGVATQVPALHAFVVHVNPSSHAFALLFAKTQPAALCPRAAGLHVSSVHAFESVQLPFTGVETQLPALQASVVHVNPSVQVFVLSFVNTQPAALAPGLPGLHASSVHALASLQFAFTGVDTQLPALHASLVHEMLSVQVFVLSFVNTQPVAGLQASSVHGLPSLHTVVAFG
jgi:hypothetical protein